MGNDLSAPYVSVTGQVTLKLLSFKVKDRPGETLVVTFYDAMKAEFLPKHTGSNLMAFHPDFTYRAKLRLKADPSLRKVTWVLNVVDATLHPDLHPWNIVHFENGIYDQSRLTPYAAKTLTTHFTPDKNGNIVHKFGGLNYIEAGYQIPAHQLLWAYAIDDHNRVHAMMSNQRIISYDVKPGAFCIDPKALEHLDIGIKVRGRTPAQERAKGGGLSKRLSALKGSLSMSRTSGGSFNNLQAADDSRDAVDQTSDQDAMTSDQYALTHESLATGSRPSLRSEGMQSGTSSETLRLVCYVQAALNVLLLAVIVYQHTVISEVQPPSE